LAHDELLGVRAETDSGDRAEDDTDLHYHLLEYCYCSTLSNRNSDGQSHHYSRIS